MSEIRHKRHGLHPLDHPMLQLKTPQVVALMKNKIQIMPMKSIEHLMMFSNKTAYTSKPVLSICPEVLLFVHFFVYNIESALNPTSI
jgi:hypothetical protein